LSDRQRYYPALVVGGSVAAVAVGGTVVLGGVAVDVVEARIAVFGVVEEDMFVVSIVVDGTEDILAGE